MNKVLLDIYLKDPENCDFIHNRKRIYEFLGDSIVIFDNYFYPYIERLNEEQRLLELIENLSDTQKEALLKIPNELISIHTINVDIIIDEDNSQYALETKCFTRVVKSYKHPAFFEFLSLISIDRDYSLHKENHKFGYHFHLYKGKKGREERTATILTFDKKEKPCKRSEDTDAYKYGTFPHSLYYEPHSEGASRIDSLDINSKNNSFRNQLYTVCKKVVVENIEKTNFKEPSKKSTKVVLS